MAAHYGAHEVMEVHEVLSKSIDTANIFQMLRPQVQDQQLGSMIDNHLQFMTQEYDNLVRTVSQNGANEAIPYSGPRDASPQYGLNSPETQRPNASPRQLNDRDIASIVLGCHKSSASHRMMAALEVADPQLRRTIQQSAVNCSEQAYDVWCYMNDKGYYQVPTMKEMTTNTMVNAYGPAPVTRGHGFQQSYPAPGH